MLEAPIRSSEEARIHLVQLFLFFQENAGNIAHRLEMVHIMLQKLKCNVFMLSYQGYGASDGFPSQDGITKNAQDSFNIPVWICVFLAGLATLMLLALQRYEVRKLEFLIASFVHNCWMLLS